MVGAGSFLAWVTVVSYLVAMFLALSPAINVVINTNLQDDGTLDAELDKMSPGATQACFSKTAAVYVSTVTDTTAITEDCTVVVATAAEETTATTTCTLTAADAAATPAVVGACAVATGSGTCTYVAPVSDRGHTARPVTR